MPFSASCRPVFVLSNGVLTFVVCHVVDFCDFFKVGQICIERVPLHGFLPVSRTPRHAYRCAASLAGFPLACQSCSILRSLGNVYIGGRGQSDRFGSRKQAMRMRTTVFIDTAIKSERVYSHSWCCVSVCLVEF